MMFHGPITTQHPDSECSHTYSEKFGAEANVILPGDAQHIGQVECKVNDASTCCCQVRSCKCCAQEETLHDSHYSVGRKEEEDYTRVTVGQQVSFLQQRQ